MAPTVHRTPRRALAAVVVALGLVAAGCVPGAPTDPETPTTTTAAPPPSVYDAACAATLVADTPGTVTAAALDEISGLAAGRRTAGVWWVHNDSGNAAAVYAIADDGSLLATFTLTDADNIDWEDVAVGPGPSAGTSYLYVADTGGAPAAPGSSDRASVQVYRLPEPTIPGSPTTVAVDVDVLTFTFPSGAKYDAEALMVDPVSEKLYLVTKEAFTSKVFEAPADLADGSATQLTQVATVPVPGLTQAFTGADVTVAGDVVALRTDDALSGNGSVVLYPRPAGGSIADAFAEDPCSGPVAAETQGEAIGFSPDGQGYVTVGEGANSPLHRFHTP